MLRFTQVSLLASLLAAATLAQAAQLSTDARSAVPHDVQQLVAIDYRAMQNSTVAMSLRDRVMPSSLKQFDEALAKSGLNDNHDVEELFFALLGSTESNAHPMTVGIAQGQFPVKEILANFRAQKIKPVTVRANKLYPLAQTSMVVCFVDPSTMLFGGFNAVKKALDSRDGMAPSLLTNAPMIDAMQAVDAEPVWSILDENGTQSMMRQLLGDAGSLTDSEAVRKRLEFSSYSMNFQHGVKFDLTLSTGDSFAAATLSSLLSAAVAVRKMSASEEEKQALSATSIDTEAGRLSIHFSTTDSEFSSLLQSPLFQGMTR
jgi:hypothetical protein